MDSWQRRTARYLLVLAAVMLLYTVVYDLGMSVFEGRPISFLHALQVVVETFTTTGFGSDSPWTSAEMNVLVILMDPTGVALIFLALPVLVFPLFEEAISTTVPTSAPEDTTTEFAILVLRDLNPDLEVVARAEETENVQKMYRAGADYVLSLATVSGRTLASTILEGEEVMALDKQVEAVRTTAPKLEGWTLGEADVRDRTGRTVVGVERDGEVFTGLGPEFRVEAGDELIIAGTDEGTNRFRQLLA